MMSFGEDVAARYDDAPGGRGGAVAFLSAAGRRGRRWSWRSAPGASPCPLAGAGSRPRHRPLPRDDRPAARKPGRPPPGHHGRLRRGPGAGRFRLIYVVFNTLFNLLTQDEQVRCFENVAPHLTDDGAFVVEAFVPAYLTRLRDDQYVDAEAIGVDEVRLDVARHDP